MEVRKSTIVILLFCILALSCQRQSFISLESLLDEMVSFEQMAEFPDPYYTCHQASSYDRRSVSPDSLFWFANGDGYVGGNFIRIDTINGRIEKVMLDHQGPGVITRMWITSLDQRPIIRFYFDGAEEAQFSIPAYDLTQIGLAGIGSGLVMPHTSYSVGEVGGSTSYFPIPYAKGCKITVEIPSDIDKNPRYYQINYRKYVASANVETFSIEGASKLEAKIKKTNDLLMNPPKVTEGFVLSENNKTISRGDSLFVELAAGQYAIYEINIDLDMSDQSDFAQTMRELIFTASFDGMQCVWAPIGDFAGGGMGAKAVSSWFLESDGHGKIVSRWIMPYRKEASLCLKNIASQDVRVDIKLKLREYQWTSQSMYFHASWRQEKNLPLSHCNDDINKSSCMEWCMTSLKGKGIFRGDALSLYNHSQSWYGEGDEKIWVDDDVFPSHFGTGTEDYYNSSWAPVVLFQTPFGGAIRADSTNSRGYNTWLRTRNLDGIPFQKKFQFDFELLSWFRGAADYSSTVFWYGELDAKVLAIPRDGRTFTKT